MVMIFELLATLVLGFMFGRIWETRQQIRRERHYR